MPKVCKRPAHPAWNAGRCFNRNVSQNIFVPRQDVDLFLSAAVWFGSPPIAIILWLGMVTSRRVSELLRLRWSDFYPQGGQYSDHPHLLFHTSPGEENHPGLGKLGAKELVVRLSPDATGTLERLRDSGLTRELLGPLAEHRGSHPQVFADSGVRRPAATEFRKMARDTDFLFPALKTSRRSGATPWMTRQTVCNGVARTRAALFQITGARRYNPSAKFRGEHVTVHGATRHTNAALLMSSKGGSSELRPERATVMELQGRTDAKTFARHYSHPSEDQLAGALAFGFVSMPGVGADGRPCEEPAAASSSGSRDGGALAHRQQGEPSERVHQRLQAAAAAATAEQLHIVSKESTCRSSSARTGHSGERSAEEGPATAERSNDREHTTATATTRSAPLSRNAWRKRKRREGRKAWAEDQPAQN